jgi:hypothetical protein
LNSQLVKVEVEREAPMNFDEVRYKWYKLRQKCLIWQQCDKPEYLQNMQNHKPIYVINQTWKPTVSDQDP